MEVIRETRLIRMIRWFTRICLSTLLMSALLIALSIVGLLYLRSQPLPESTIHETTILYAADGQVIDTVNRGQNRKYVPVEDMPVHLLQAAIAVEDQRFFQHHGIDVRRVVGAMIANIKQGGYVEGASTLTQQLARNLYLNHEKTWSRKLKEALYAIQLELHYTKTEILERYLNQIYFGHSAYGVEAAAELFFGKKVHELSLAESALLIGIPKGPRYYSPWLNEDNAFNRQRLILSLMENQGYITAEEREEALAEELFILDQKAYVQRSSDHAPYFNDYVRQMAIQHYGIEEEMFDQGGLKIYTTLDPQVQEVAEQAFSSLLPEERELQGALVAMDPRSGYIKAMVGGKDYQSSQYNRAFAARQPGSALKPLLYYSALENGLTPLTEMKSEPTTFTYDEGRATYTPRNFNDSYVNDYITMERALAKSDNIYAVKTLMFLGEETFVDTLQRFGIDRSFEPLPSLALGAQNVSLFDMVKAYSTLANGGNVPKPLAIIKIEDRKGNLIVEEQPSSVQALDPAYTFVLNRMMRGVFEPGGTGYRVSHLVERPVAGKTGSTDTDSWMIGYTPQLVAGVWVGYDRNQLINHNNDGRIAAEIWATFLEQSLHEQMPALFPIPEGVVGAYINPDNGNLATEYCPVKRLLYFIEGTEPTEYCHDHLPEHETTPEPVEVEEPSSIWQKLKDWWRH